MAKGHSVNLAAPSRFQTLVEDHGIRFVPLAGDPEDLSRRFNDAGYNFIRIFRELMSHAIDIGAEVLQQTEEACKGADLIIHTFAHAVGGHTLAREKNIPDLHVQGFPMFTPTGDYPNITLPDWKLRPLNRLTHQIALKLTWLGSKFGFEQVRHRAGLSRRELYFPFDNDPHCSPTPILCAWSPSVIAPSRDWQPNVHVTGYFFSEHDSAYQPELKLQEFLEKGDAPICVSFGSMLNRNANKIDDIVRQAIRQTSNRGIILSGWGGLKHTASREIFYIDSVPHQWLLPRCEMIIHHGGAGTTSAGLRAGIPNIVIPHTADQPFWGNRVHAIGAGPKPIPVKELSVENLTRAILEAKDSMLRRRAESIGQSLRREDGVGVAVSLIEKYAKDFLR
jgi:UDP:flavonoid glycosyltransferase YjiC (YdhE family)